MGEAAGAEGAVAGLAEGVVLGGDAGPVIEGVSEFVLDGEAADLPAGVAGLDADGGDSGAGAECGVVAALEQGEGFGEESAEDVDPDSGQGEEDGGVVGALVVGVVLGERLQQFADVLTCLGEELVGGVCLGEEALEGSAGGLGGSGGDGERGGVQDLPQAFGVQSADAVFFEEFGEGRDAQLEGPCGGFGLVPELDEPGVGELVEEVGDGEELGVVAPGAAVGSGGRGGCAGKSTR